MCRIKYWCTFDKNDLKSQRKSVLYLKIASTSAAWTFRIQRGHNIIVDGKKFRSLLILYRCADGGGETTIFSISL